MVANFARVRWEFNQKNNNGVDRVNKNNLFRDCAGEKLLVHSIKYLDLN